MLRRLHVNGDLVRPSITLREASMSDHFCDKCKWYHHPRQPCAEPGQVLNINSIDENDPYAEDLLDEAAKDLMEEKDGRYR